MSNLSNTCILILGIVLIFLWILSTKIKSRGGELFQNPADRNRIKHDSSINCEENCNIYNVNDQDMVCYRVPPNIKEGTKIDISKPIIECKNCLIIYDNEDNRTLYKFVKHIGKGAHGSVSEYNLNVNPPFSSNSLNLPQNIIVKNIDNTRHFNIEVNNSELINKYSDDLKKYVITSLVVDGDIKNNKKIILEKMVGTLNDKQWSMKEALKITIHIVKGLNKLYEKGLLYLDVKAGNIGYDELSNTKLLDIGSIYTDIKPYLGKFISTYPSYFQMIPIQKPQISLDEVIVIQQIIPLAVYFVKPSLLTYIQHNVYSPNNVNLFRRSLQSNKKFLEKEFDMDSQIKILLINVALLCLSEDIAQIPNFTYIIRMLEEFEPRQIVDRSPNRGAAPDSDAESSDDESPQFTPPPPLTKTSPLFPYGE